MGLSFSCPFAAYNDPENGMESIIVKSISLGDEESKTPRRSVSFKGKDADPMIMKSLGSGKMVLEGPVSFKQRQTDTLVSISVPSWVDRKADVPERSFCNNNIEMDKQSPKSDENGPSSSITDLASPKHEAALKLQKVYKSFRTRRKLADCAVLVEHSWWKLLDFAVLKHSSISFFDIEHHETAISRWSRAKTRAAKVGKGLSKNDKAQKLALQHWLEAIDPRHRYGHNLHFYYVKWLQSQSREPFFYWLDIGEGKEVNLEKCPRLKLQQQCIKYLGPMERKAYEVAVEDGKLYYRCSGELLDTSSEPHAKWIFVLSTSKTLHVGKKKKGRFQHSSFLAGGATSAAGRLVVEKGILKAVWPHSGHYRPTPENFQDFMSYLRENNVELRDVKMDPIDADEQPLNKQRSSIHIRSGSTEEDFAEEGLHGAAPEQKTPAVLEQPNSLRSRSFIHNLTNLQIPKRDDLLLNMQRENSIPGPSVDDFQREASHDGYDSGTEEEFGSDRDDSVLLHNICDKEFKEDREESIPDESILKRINSHKEAKSYQLGKQLSCKWTTGAGPRIGCVRDYPSELQAQVLEQVNLSPRISGQAKALPSPCCATGLSLKASTPKTLVSQTSIRHCRLQSSPLSRCIKLPLY